MGSTKLKPIPAKTMAPVPILPLMCAACFDPLAPAGDMANVPPAAGAMVVPVLSAKVYQ